MIVISPIQEKIVCALGKYKFLTSNQAWKLVGNKNIQTIYNDFRVLRERGIVDCIVYGGVSRSGTMHKLNYLTGKGAKVTAEIEGVELDQVRYPKSSNTLVKNDFFHRINTIDLMIAFDLWVEQTDRESVFFDVYFDKVGSQRKQGDGALHSKTRVQTGQNAFIDPDAIFAYRTKQSERLFVLEIANGLDTKRIIKQIREGVFATYQGKVSDKYKMQTTAKILLALEHPGTKQAVMERVKADEYLTRFEGLENYLFFALQSEAKENWAGSWQTIEGRAVDVFS